MAAAAAALQKQNETAGTSDTKPNAASIAQQQVQLSREAKAAARHRLVRTWTKNVDIFDMDFVIIPINENAHWYLAIICYPGLVEQQQSSKVMFLLHMYYCTCLAKKRVILKLNFSWIWF